MFNKHAELRVIAVYYFFYYAFLGAFAPYLGPYLRTLGVPMAMIGLMVSLPQINRIYSSVIWGWVADFFGHRTTVLRLAGMGTLAGFVILLFTRSTYGMFAALFIASFFWCAIIPQVDATTMTLLKGDSGRYARMRAWGSIGFMVATLAGGYLIDLYGIRWFPVIVVTLVIVASFLIWYVPDTPASKTADKQEGLNVILRRQEVRVLFFSCLLVGAAHGLLSSFYSIHLEEHGIAKSAMGWLWSVGITAEIILFWSMPHLTRTLNLRHMYLFAMGAAIVRYLMIGWGANSLWILVPAQLLHAFTFGVHHAVSITYVYRNFGATHQGKGQALYNIVTFGIGGGLGTLISGLLWNTIGGNWMFTLASGTSLTALLICRHYLRDILPSSEPAPVARMDASK